jgi:hypothetical protein
LVTKAKPRDDTGGLPLLVDPERAMRELGVGRASLDELERQELLRRVPLGNLRVIRYRREDVLALAGINPPESVDAIDARTEAAAT